MISGQRTFQGHHEEYGSGMPVLCLSGLGCSNWIFKPMAEALASTFQLILPDNRGMGKSPQAEAAYTIEDLAADALALMDDLGHQRFAVVGISMGGFIGMSLTLMAPERVRGLVLMCTTGPGAQFHPIPVLSDELLDSNYRMPVDERARMNTEVTTFPGYEARDPSGWQWIVEQKIAHMADLEQLRFQNAAAADFIGKALPLNQINCRTLVLTGSDDRFVDPDNSRILGETIGNAEVVSFPQTDHLFFLEKAAEVNARVSGFLEQL